MAANTQGRDGEEVIFDIMRESIMEDSVHELVPKHQGHAGPALRGDKKTGL